MPYKLPPEVVMMLEKKRYYIFFEDGSWRTQSESGDEWKAEQLYKLPTKLTAWVGGPEVVQIVEAVFTRCMLEKSNGQ